MWMKYDIPLKIFIPIEWITLWYLQSFSGKQLFFFFAIVFTFIVSLQHRLNKMFSKKFINGFLIDYGLEIRFCYFVRCIHKFPYNSFSSKLVQLGFLEAFAKWVLYIFIMCTVFNFISDYVAYPIDSHS